MLGFTRSYLRQLWDRLQSSYWFMPLVFALLGVLLANLLIGIDNAVDSASLQRQNLLVSTPPDDARAAMISLAATTLATTGIVFTLMTLSISVVASQFGSRLLRVYLRDRTTQLVLSVFTLTFVYSVALALLIPPTSVNTDPPSVSMSMALALTVLTFASLVVLIHHVGVTLQAPSVVAAASKELMSAVQQVNMHSLREQAIGQKETALIVEIQVRNEGKPIHAVRLGYVQFVDFERLVPLAARRDLVLRMECMPGDFVEVGDLLAYAWPGKQVDDLMVRRIRSCIKVSNSRLPMQDLRYAVNQVTEVGQRALSPAINDPFTAMTVFDHLAAALALYAGSVRDFTAYFDLHDRLRVIRSPTHFDELIDLAFTMPRLASGNNILVYLKLLSVLVQIGERADSPDRVATILRHVDLTHAQASNLAITEADKQRVLSCCFETSVRLQARLELLMQAAGKQYTDV